MRLSCVAGGAIAVALLVFAGPVLAVKTVTPLTGAIFTTDADCDVVNQNLYDSKDDVYLDGGPKKPGAAGLPNGFYAVQVTDPSGKVLLGTTVGSANEAPVQVVDGEFVQCYQLSAILVRASNGAPGYDDTPNAGGEYKVWVTRVAVVDGDGKGTSDGFDDNVVITFDPNLSKTDNFKVKAQEDCVPPPPKG